ncbi:hypothetical protein K505DRAFT_374911 [Melanomma pulvis-pyrius CBS 109.77]|uniref:Uncharacterized protein n=1 Tax=Melanomma pulvis-pyrius CBS 109.77 TaxID=1314802 RepID=A0A6A6XEB9_9PLEO|nr:hypothetical protein K505DRAFT_374911 [Melanomma pulvis-pyrius CBS 109.77]
MSTHIANRSTSPAPTVAPSFQATVTDGSEEDQEPIPSHTLHQPRPPLHNAFDNAVNKSATARGVDPDLIAQIIAEVKKELLDEIRAVKKLVNEIKSNGVGVASPAAVDHSSKPEEDISQEQDENSEADPGQGNDYTSEEKMEVPSMLSFRYWWNPIGATYHNMLRGFGQNPYKIHGSIYVICAVFLVSAIIVSIARFLYIAFSEDPQASSTQRKKAIAELSGILVIICPFLVQITLFFFPPLLANMEMVESFRRNCARHLLSKERLENEESKTTL